VVGGLIPLGFPPTHQRPELMAWCAALDSGSPALFGADDLPIRITKAAAILNLVFMASSNKVNRF
jgi:hypothetical protein